MAAQLLNAHRVRQLATIVDYQFFHGEVAMRAELVDQFPDVAQATADAYVEAILWTRLHPEETAAIMQKVPADVADDEHRRQFFGLDRQVPLFRSSSIGSRRGEQLNPIVQLARPIPPIAWIPLLMVWMGIGDQQSITVIFIAAFFPILLNTVLGVQAVPKEYVEAALTLGAKRSTVIRRVVFPASLPIIITGLRVGLGFAWVAVIAADAAELIGASSGLGYMLQGARYQLQSDVVVLAMVSIGVIGLMVDMLFLLLTSPFVKWHARRRSAAR